MFAIEFLIGSAVWLVVLIFVRRYESAHEGKSVSSAFDTDAGSGVSCSESAPGAFNPATGLPMVGNVDTAGNPYGSSLNLINPATGLFMVGNVDAAGNPYGSSDD